MINEKVVLITGAGSGLGRALSKAFCEAGAKVIALGRSIESLEQTKETLDISIKDNFDLYQADVSDFKSTKKVVGDALSKYQKIDYVFNNAAVYPKLNFLDESAEDFAQAINININGVANICKAVLPAMIEAKSGRIFNLGSWADMAPIANSVAYSASKGAIHGLTKAIAADIEALNLDIQVHEWIPGHLNTQMSEFTGIDPALSASWALMLAQRENSKKNSLFDRDREWLPPKSLKQKIKSKVLFWKK